MPVTLSLRVSIPIITRLELYGRGGIGAYYVYDCIELNYDRYHDYISDDKTALGFHLGGGAKFTISAGVFCRG